MLSYVGWLALENPLSNKTVNSSLCQPNVSELVIRFSVARESLNGTRCTYSSANFASSARLETERPEVSKDLVA